MDTRKGLFSGVNACMFIQVSNLHKPEKNNMINDVRGAVREWAAVVVSLLGNLTYGHVLCMKLTQMYYVHLYYIRCYYALQYQKAKKKRR